MAIEDVSELDFNGQYLHLAEVQLYQAEIIVVGESAWFWQECKLIAVFVWSSTPHQAPLSPSHHSIAQPDRRDLKH